MSLRPAVINVTAGSDPSQLHPTNALRQTNKPTNKQQTTSHHLPPFVIRVTHFQLEEMSLKNKFTLHFMLHTLTYSQNVSVRSILAHSAR